LKNISKDICDVTNTTHASIENIIGLNNGTLKTRVAFDWTVLLENRVVLSYLEFVRNEKIEAKQVFGKTNIISKLEGLNGNFLLKFATIFSEGYIIQGPCWVGLF
jgi:hypothetical protein